MTLKDKLYTGLVLASIFAILWGARLALIYFVSDHWFGTLGITSLILGSITYLSWKDRLGRYGQIYKKALTHKLMKKFTKWRLVLGIFFILMFAAFSAGMHASKDTYQMETTQTIEKIEAVQGEQFFTQEETISRAETMIKEKPVITILSVILGMLLLPLIAVLDFPAWSVAVGMVNHVFAGQMVHLIDILLIEQVELMGILVFVHWIQRKDKTLPSYKV